MEPTTVRTYQKRKLDKILRKRKKTKQTETLTSVVDDAIKLLAEKESVK